MMTTPEQSSYADVLMRHPDLGDLTEVPWFAVDDFTERGYLHVDQLADETVPAPSGANTTRATTTTASTTSTDATSGTATTSGPDSGNTAATSAS